MVLADIKVVDERMDEAGKQRELHIVRVVLSHCADRIWPDDLKRQAEAKSQAMDLVGVGNGNGTTGGSVSKVTAGSVADADGDSPQSASSMQEQVEDTTLPLRVVILSGGITNELFRVFDPACPEQSVVVRVFGKETERFIQRERELFYQHFFIQTFLRGADFLVYEYLNGYQALTVDELPTSMEGVANALAHLHIRATLEAKTDFDYLGAPPNSAVSRYASENNFVMNALPIFLSIISSEEIESKVDPGKLEDFLGVVRQTQYAIPILVEQLKSNEHLFAEAICHNDLLGGNVLRSTGGGDGTLKIVDFDYAHRSFVLFDLANHLNEYAGEDWEFEARFPSDDHIYSFVRCYRKAVRQHRKEMDSLIVERNCQEEIIDRYEEYEYSSEEQEHLVALRWVSYVKFLTLASNLFWAGWGLVQEAVSSLDVDFLTYSKVHVQRYLDTKDEFFHIMP